MYTPKHFDYSSSEIIYKIINDYPFASFITTEPHFNITKVPFDLYNNEYLFGHIAKKNEQVNDLYDGKKAICIFDGPHSYISPSVYDKVSVPTWNYISAQVEIEIELIKDPKEFLFFLNSMVNKYELNLKNRFEIAQMPDVAVSSLLNQIVGFKCHIKSIQLKMKLSQNKSKETQERIIKWLDEQNDQNANNIATYMKSITD